ncbi:putative quinol monooxygenase [Flexithrix dorotheae]|uniref:putative quinol monooxygenase n=1 Tax=Flexithrix dorotheae TaxID=70993 RepID=UPI00037962DB|nr:putative quinol monooxygenase [Flexithrix dorotheae]
MSNKVVGVAAHIEAKPGNSEAVKEILKGFVAPTRKEKGCIQYELFQSEETPEKFTFLEKWESLEDLEAHGQSSHITSGKEKLAELLVGPSDVRVSKSVD